MGLRIGSNLVDRAARVLSRFRELAWPERWLLGQTQVVVLLVALGLRLRGYGRLKALLERTSPLGDAGRRDAGSGSGLGERVQRVAEVVDISLRRGPFGGTCLERSLTLWWLLRRRGVESRLRFGVRREEEFEAHAWVEIDGVILNDQSEPDSHFAPIDHTVG